jgi:hypothetical protein
MRAVNRKVHFQIGNTTLVCDPLLEARILAARNNANNCIERL